VQAAPPATEEQAEPVEEEEDIDKEFEKELEPEPTLSPPKFGLPVAPKPEIPAVPPAATIPPVIVPKPPAPKIPAPIVDVPGLPDFPELPESEAPVVEPPPVDIPVPEIEPPTPVELPVPDLPNSPKLPENGIPLIELPPAEVLEIVPVSAEVPGPDAPAPVTVENWERMPVSPALPAQEIPEILEPVDSKTPIVIPPPPVEIPAPKIIPPAATIPPVDIPETPESEPPTIPAPSVSVPALDTPLPVSVTNWDQMVARSDVQEPKTPNSPDLPAVNVPVVEVPSAEVLVPGNEPSTPTEPPGLEAPALQEPDVPDPLPTLTIVWPDLLATLPEPKVSEPVVDAPDVVVPAVGVSVQEIPDIPEPTVPELSSRPIPPAFDLPIPVTVINWPDTLKPVPAVPLTEEERVTPADKEPDVDEEFVDLPEPTIVWPDLPKIQIPKIQIPDIVAAAMPPDPDAGALTRILGLIGGGETRVVVELDGYAIGETLFRTWNRRTGGALNG
jgi:hypothetical protein